MNKSKFAFAAVTFALLMGALLFANFRRQQTPTYILAQYPRSATWDWMRERHLRNAPNAVFLADWFDAPTTETAKGCSIGQSGNRICSIYSLDSTNRSQQATRTSVVPPARLKNFQTALRQMPPGLTRPPQLGHLLVISFQDGAQWTTRIYDRDNLPPQIYRLNEFHLFKTIPEH